MRARWAAEGCLAVAQVRLDSMLGKGGALTEPAADTLRFQSGASCDVEYADPDATRDSSPNSYSDRRVNLNDAPDSVVATLPGIGAEALRVIAASRDWRRPLADLPDLAGRLSPAARAALFDHYGELTGLASFHPTALVVTARGWTDVDPVQSVIEALMVNGGGRAAMTRRKMT